MIIERGAFHMNLFQQSVELESQKTIEKIMAIINDDSLTNFTRIYEISDILKQLTDKINEQLPPPFRV